MWCEKYLLAHSSQFKVNWKRSSCRFRIGSCQLLCFLEDTILTSLSFTKDLVGWGSLLPRDVHRNFSSIPQGWQWKDGRMECRRGSGRLKQTLWTLSSKKSTWTCCVSRFPTTANRAEQRHQAFIGSLTCKKPEAMPWFQNKSEIQIKFLKYTHLYVFQSHQSHPRSPIDCPPWDWYRKGGHV